MALTKTKTILCVSVVFCAFSTNTPNRPIHNYYVVFRASILTTRVASNSEAEADVAAAYALHANGYLLKPLDAVQFAAMIEALVTYWLEWNHPPQRRLSRGVAAWLP